MASPEEHSEILRLLRENTELLKENNKLLHTIHRWSIYEIIFKVIWYSILIGLPFALYFYVIQPYLSVLGNDYESFRQSLGEIPGLSGLFHLLPAVGE